MNNKKAGEGIIDEFVHGNRGYWKAAADWAMGYVDENRSNMNQYLGYCLLNNINCGKMEPGKWDIYKKERGGFHFRLDNKYNDPDKISYVLYMLAYYKFSKKWNR